VGLWSEPSRKTQLILEFAVCTANVTILIQPRVGSPWRFFWKGRIGDPVTSLLIALELWYKARVAEDSTTTDSHERFYLPELDVLRFFAFLAVFGWHLAWGVGYHFQTKTGTDFFATHQTADRLLRSGEWGVDLFFALSAYLLTELLL
jgi:hypothetical protein